MSTWVMRAAGALVVCGALLVVCAREVGTVARRAPLPRLHTLLQPATCQPWSVPYPPPSGIIPAPTNIQTCALAATSWCQHGVGLRTVGQEKLYYASLWRCALPVAALVDAFGRPTQRWRFRTMERWMWSVPDGHAVAYLRPIARATLDAVAHSVSFFWDKEDEDE